MWQFMSPRFQDYTSNQDYNDPPPRWHLKPRLHLLQNRIWNQDYKPRLHLKYLKISIDSKITLAQNDPPPRLHLNFESNSKITNQDDTFDSKITMCPNDPSPKITLKILNEISRLQTKMTLRNNDPKSRLHNKLNIILMNYLN